MDTSFLADLIQNIQYDSGDKRSLSPSRTLIDKGA